MLNQKFVYTLNDPKINKRAHKNKPGTHSPQQNKKAVLTTTANYKVSTPVRSISTAGVLAKS